MSTAALSRSQSKTIPGLGAVMAIGSWIYRHINRRVKTGNDERALQMLPDNVLADLGLEKVEIMTGTNGGRQVWVIPHRYY